MVRGKEKAELERKRKRKEEIAKKKAEADRMRKPSMRNTYGARRRGTGSSRPNVTGYGRKTL
jgi:hypothetical protein